MADDPDSQQTQRIPAHDVATLKLCVASAWLHGSISAGRAHELAEVLACEPGEIEALRALEAQEARADD
ncbi:MAG: hypothetical protein JO157_09245 [Acetobacteraceae bacterium]|nr:hypothetical protein [Acetobacteraceae bacterium]